MQVKLAEKEKAIALRKEGRTYKEILAILNIAKSTLAIWLTEAGMAKSQSQRITDLRMLTQKKGAQRKREIRIDRQKEIHAKSAAQIGSISKRELWLIGVALYWAEGSKQKEYYPSAGVDFSNSDPFMIRLFLQWIENCTEIKREMIKCEIYIHESCQNRIAGVVDFWSQNTNFPKEHFTRIYFKKNKINTKRKNTGNLYYGVLRVSITASTDFNRQIKGWTLGILDNCGIV